MTAPVWMAFPPEVHSALLSSGPGPGSLLAAAAAWNSLSTEYTTAADELSALVAAVPGGTWEGPSADSYVAANVPYVAWLLQNSANSTEMAAQHVTAAAAYTTALAAMPTLPELAANHATHAALVATNFFGINTIPIGLNEADYARMWVQAATTMSTYQAVSTAAVAAAPQTTPAPQIVKADATADPSTSTTGAPPPLPTWLSDLLQWLGYTPPTKVPLPVNPGQYPTLSGSFLSNILNDLQITAGEFTIHPGETLGQEVGQQLFYFWYTTTYLLPNELQAIAHGNLSQIFSLNTIAVLFSYVIMRIGNILAVVNYLALEPQYLIPVLPAFAPLATVSVTGFAGLANLAQQAVAVPAIVPAVVPTAPPVALAPVLSAAPVPAPATAPAPVTAPAVTAVGAPPPPPSAAPPPPVATGAEGYAYMVANLSMGAQARARAKTDEPLYRSGTKAPPLTAPAATREPALLRRRRTRVQQLGRGYEYMDLDQDLDMDMDEPDRSNAQRLVSVAASDRGAGTLGFAGTTPKEAGAAAAGLTTMPGDAFGGGPTVPMVPGTWATDPVKSDRPLEGQDDA
jgi:PPE-repeat protein